MLVIRKLAARDTPEIVKIFDLTADQWERFVRQEVNEGGKGFRVAEREGRVIGAATSSRRTPGREIIRHFRIIVAAEQRRQGAGRALLAEMAQLDEEEHTLLQSLVPEAWTAGRLFLERLGFEVVEAELEMECKRARVAPAEKPSAEIGPEKDIASVAERVAALHNAAYAHDVSFVPFTAKAMEALLADAELWLARRDGEIAGFVHLEDSSKATWIESIVVAEKARGTGLGTELGAAVLADISDRRKKLAKLSVSDKNAAARHLYEKLGFVKTDASYRFRAPASEIKKRLA